MNLNLLFQELKKNCKYFCLKDSQSDIQNWNNIYLAGFKVGLFNGGQLCKRSCKKYVTSGYHSIHKIGTAGFFSFHQLSQVGLVVAKSVYVSV